MGPTVTQRTRGPARGILCARQSGRDWRGVSQEEIPCPTPSPAGPGRGFCGVGCHYGASGACGGSGGQRGEGDSGAPEADCEGLRGWVRRQPGAGAWVTPHGLRNVRKLWGYPRTHPLERLLGAAAEQVTPPLRRGPAAAGGVIVRQIVKKFWNLPALRQSSPTGKLQTHCALSRKNALTCKCLKTC